MSPLIADNTNFFLSKLQKMEIFARVNALMEFRSKQLILYFDKFYNCQHFIYSQFCKYSVKFFLMQYSRSENVDPKIFVRKSLKCISQNVTPSDSFKAFSLLYKINFMHMISKNDRCQMFFFELCALCCRCCYIQ